MVKSLDETKKFLEKNNLKFDGSYEFKEEDRVKFFDINKTLIEVFKERFNFLPHREKSILESRIGYGSNLLR